MTSIRSCERFSARVRALRLIARPEVVRDWKTVQRVGLCRYFSNPLHAWLLAMSASGSCYVSVNAITRCSARGHGRVVASSPPPPLLDVTTTELWS